MIVFDWIPSIRLAGLSFASPSFLISCAPLVVLCCLALSKRWARFTDAPIVFAVVYGMPFLILTFQESHGDSIQMTEQIGARYYMSEPASTWVHYWSFYFLHEPFNVGAKFVIGLSSRVAGFVYLWAVASISQCLFPDLSASRRLVYRLMFFTAGWTLLFYGYVENTPLAVPAEQIWVLTSLVFLRIPSFPNLFKCGAALALATAFHGRAAFLAPALILLCLIPSGTLTVRIKRSFFAGAVYAGLLALMVAYIVLIDFRYISGSVFGNSLGGGNRQMLVALDVGLRREHWEPLVSELFIAGGVLAPFALLFVPRALFRRESIFLWAVGYLVADLAFVFLWEFDYGPFSDWDLIFSGVGPLLLLAGIVVTRSRVPIFLILPFLLASGVLSMAFGAILNGGPLPLNLVPRAAGLVSSNVCNHAGLRRTFFSDEQLTNPIGPSESDLPFHLYTPAYGEGLGGVFEGYIKIPAEGRYRFHLLGQGNLRFRLAQQTLYERWTGLEWQITTEREMRFSEPGWFPIRLDFFSSAAPSIAIELRIESAEQPRRPVTLDELCYE
jgi:hypothetical protein